MSDTYKDESIAELLAANEKLEAKLAAAEATTKRYQELLHGVARKYPHETRHQTALRYILMAENADLRPQYGCDAAIAAAADSRDG